VLPFPSVMRKTLAAMFVVGMLSAPAWARDVKDFQEPSEMSAEELAQAKADARSSLHSFKGGVTSDVKGIPWTALGLVALIALVISPFAYRAFKDTAKELGSGRTRR